MRNTLYAFVLIAAVCGLVVAQTAAPPAAGWRYNPADETTIQGTIQQVTRLQGTYGTHVMLNTPQGMQEVALGPAWFIEQQKDLTLTPGSVLKVTGAPVTVNGTKYFVAREVEENGKTITLRNAQGVPVWAGAGRIAPGYMGQMDPPNTQGQTDPGQMQGRTGMRASSIYNPKTETTITGTVQEVTHYVCGPWAGSYAVLDTPEGRMNVQLGPSEYLRSQGMEIKPGETMHVTGSRIDVDGVEVLLARSVTAGGRTVALRTAQGVPEWAGAMRPGSTPPRTDQQY